MDVEIYVEVLKNDNLALGQLIVGQESQPTVVQLQDAINNGNRSSCVPEAVYLNLKENYQKGLRILGGSYTQSWGLQLLQFQDGSWVHINRLFPQGVHIMSYDGGFIQKGARPCDCDLNHDCRCDMQDWLLFGQDRGRTDCNDPGVDPCECDLNNDGRCDMQDWLLFGQQWGWSICP